MKILYLDCGTGAAGDMLTSALYELLTPEQQKAFLEKMNALGVEGLEVSAEKAVKMGITGSQIRVRVRGEEEESIDVPTEHHHEHHHEHEHDHDHDHHDHDHHDHDHEHEHDYDHHHDHDHHHAHYDMATIEKTIHRMPLPFAVKMDAMAVYRDLAEAESHVHGIPVSEIHFHEVGRVDAIADIVAVCYLIHLLDPDRIEASAVSTGSGFVRCAHGVLPVPAPATAYLLRGIPNREGGIEMELCTPTGAALLRHFVEKFGSRPDMIVTNTGYGMGHKDLPRLNAVRSFLGEALPEEKSGQAAVDPSGGKDRVVLLECNLDDTTGEDLGFATEVLLEAGARDAFVTPIYMKKNRPAYLLSVICTEDRKEALVRKLFETTGTIGIREHVCDRYVLDRAEEVRETKFGPVRFKKVSGYGVTREKPEYEDLARIAKERGLSTAQIRKEVME